MSNLGELRVWGIGRMEKSSLEYVIQKPSTRTQYQLHHPKCWIHSGNTCGFLYKQLMAVSKVFYFKAKTSQTHSMISTALWEHADKPVYTSPVCVSVHRVLCRQTRFPEQNQLLLEIWIFRNRTSTLLADSHLWVDKSPIRAELAFQPVMRTAG